MPGPSASSQDARGLSEVGRTVSGVDPDARSRTAAKLSAVADDPAWPPVLRIETLEALRARGSMTRPIPWRMRRAALRAAIAQLVTGRHVYIATSCLHGDCSHCRSGRRLDGGPKRPMCCKWCEAPCRCPDC